LRTDQQRWPDVFYRLRECWSDGCKHAKCLGTEHGFQHDFSWPGGNQCQPVSNDPAAIEYFDDEHNDDHVPEFDHVAKFDDSEHHDSEYYHPGQLAEHHYSEYYHPGQQQLAEHKQSEQHHNSEYNGSECHYAGQHESKQHITEQFAFRHPGTEYYDAGYFPANGNAKHHQSSAPERVTKHVYNWHY